MNIRTIVVAVSLAFAVGCGGSGGDQKPNANKTRSAAKKADSGKKAIAENKDPAPEPEQAPLPPQVEKAAKLADAIDAKPEDADEILDQNEMDREALDQLMYEIATDPELSAAYESARAG